jgi:hypothetical protein
LTVRRLQLPTSEAPVLLATVHLPDKRSYQKESSQTTIAVKVSQEIKQVETREKNRRTILVGDLNMNPFDAGVTNAMGFHGVMTKKRTEKTNREVDGEKYPFFYNPMWNLFGDFHNKVPGTYYYQCSEPECLFWNILDQVLIRPELISRFEDEKLQIISNFNGTSLISSRDRLPKKELSDHLPILFSINL